MSATMDSPKDTVVTAAIENLEIVQADTLNASTTTQTQDMPFNSGADDGTQDPVAGSDQIVNANESDQKSRTDALAKTFLRLFHQSVEVLSMLRQLWLRRAKIRVSRSYPPLDSVELRNIPERTLRGLCRKPGREKRISDGLVEVHSRLEEINNNVQIALETHSSIPEMSAQSIGPGHHKMANHTLLRLRSMATFVNSTTRRLVHAVHLNDLDAYHYPQNSGVLT